MTDDTHTINHSLIQINENDYDLEIHDTDEQLTFHTYLHKNTVDQIYLPDRNINKQHTTMTLDIITMLARVSNDTKLAHYLHKELIKQHALHKIMHENTTLIDTGTRSNFSNYNMSFTKLWLTQHYLYNDLARSTVTKNTNTLYNTKKTKHQPSSQAQTFYNFIFKTTHNTTTITHPLSTINKPTYTHDLANLTNFPTTPFFKKSIINCDKTEITTMTCTTIDNKTTLTLLDKIGQNDKLVTKKALPITLHPPNNYH